MMAKELIPDRTEWLFSILYFALDSVDALVGVDLDDSKIMRIIDIGRTLGYENPDTMEFIEMTAYLKGKGQLVAGFDLNELANAFAIEEDNDGDE